MYHHPKRPVETIKLKDEHGTFGGQLTKNIYVHTLVVVVVAHTNMSSTLRFDATTFYTSFLVKNYKMEMTSIYVNEPITYNLKAKKFIKKKEKRLGNKIKRIYK